MSRGPKAVALNLSESEQAGIATPAAAARNRSGLLRPRVERDTSLADAVRSRGGR